MEAKCDFLASYEESVYSSSISTQVQEFPRMEMEMILYGICFICHIHTPYAMLGVYTSANVKYLTAGIGNEQQVAGRFYTLHSG